MALVCCFAGIDDDKVGMLRDVLHAAGEPALATIAHLKVSELGRLAPGLLVCDVDDLLVDPMELVRRLRFVLPSCVIVVYTQSMDLPWAMALHLAGAQCVLSKQSTRSELAGGVHDALRSGCFTDPRFATA
jgi:DNA-binding NarL/FixJ family response regulator